MESGKVLPFLCLILVCVLHLSNGQCPNNEEPVRCRNDCNTCELQGFCYDCSSSGCDCIPGYARNIDGVCIETSQCSSMDDVDVDPDVQVSESGGCPRQHLCYRSCQRSGRRGGRCVGRGRRLCICF